MEQSQNDLDTATTSTTTTTPDMVDGNTIGIIAATTTATTATTTLSADLLWHTLSNIWQNYQLAAEDVDTKRHWLQLFLYNFQFVNEEFLTQAQFKSFFHPIPEEICSFLLEQVYEIISQSNLFPTVHLNINNIEEIQNSTELLRRKHNFAQLILNGPSDCSKIVALRTYLTNDLGQHLLQFLLKIDIKLIASLKGLCNLCFNLFPNCPWSAENLKAIDIQPTYTLITDNQRTKTTSTIAAKTTTTTTSTFQLKFSTAQEENQSTSHHIFPIQEDYADFKCATKTSDEIAYILIKILAKCVETECDAKQLSSQSMSVMTLNFALDSLLVADKAFGQLHNTYVLKYELLQLIQKCLQNIFARHEHINAIQFDTLFAKLAAALGNNGSEEFKGESQQVVDSPERKPTAATLNTARFYYALNFVVFNVIHNLVAAFSDRRQHLLGNNTRQHLYTMKFMNEHVLETCVDTLKQLLKHKQDVQIQTLSACSFKMLIKIIENLNKYEQMSCSNSGGGGGGGGKGGAANKYQTQQRPPRRRKMYTTQKHCSKQTQKLRCYFQGILWELLPELCNDELQAYAMRYLLRAGTCCCHYTVDNFGICLKVALNLEESQQKCAYKFIYRKLLNAIFVRNIGTPTKKKSDVLNCTKCDAKLKSKEFHAGLLKLYKRQYELLAPQNEIMPLVHYLKHLKHIAHLLSHDIAAGILAEIALPAFRQFKTEVMNFQKPESAEIIETQQEKVFWRRRISQQSDTTPTNVTFETPKTANSAPTTPHRPQLPPLQIQINSKAPNEVHANNLKVVHECLDIFIMYLSDIRLIKAFYNEENIKHLEDLLNEPELIRGICDLIKIGIDNITFLGDNSQEQLNLSQRLITLQLNSSDHAAQLFNALLTRFAKGTRKNFWLDEQNKKTTTTQSVQPLDILHSVAVQWSLNYELLKTSQYFYNEFAKIYSIVVENENEEEDGGGVEQMKSPNRLQRGDKTIIDILKLNYNALSSFLLLPPPRRKSATTTQQHRTTEEQKTNIYQLSPITPTSSNSSARDTEKDRPRDADSDIFKVTASDLVPNISNDSINIITATTTSSSISNVANNGFDCFSNSLDAWLSSIDSNSEFSINSKTTTSLTASSSLSFATATVEGSYVNCNELVALVDNTFDYDTLSRLYDAQLSATEIETYLQNLNSLTTSVTSSATTSATSECLSTVIFDIRNYKKCTLKTPTNQLNAGAVPPLFKHSYLNCNVYAKSNNNNNNNSSLCSNSNISNLNNHTSANDTLSTILSDPKTHERVVHSNEGIIGKLFSMFGAFFGGSHASSINDLSGNNNRNVSDDEIDSDLLCFYDICGDGKKLLLNLFEATMAICIKGYQNEEAEKMQKHLCKLRAVILSNASKDWSQHGEEHHSRENLVLQTLQTLLKIAELSNAANDPAAVINNMTLGGGVESGTCGGGGVGGIGDGSSDNETIPTILTGRQRARSFNSPRSNLLPPLLHARGASLLTPPTPHRPLSAESGDMDYFSTRATTVRPDSEVELSENDNDNENENDDGYYQTADEGYEADGEIPEISDSEIDSDVIELWHTFPPTSRYRTHVLHEGLCRLIVEILMELSQMCTRNPVGWSDNLAQLANRLFVIREHLGGPLFLLRGFKPVLECNDGRLRELQQSILELVTDLSTPEVLCTYFNILASRNPPMDILVKYMHYICAGSLKKIQPSIELEFPVVIDGKCISTSDRKISELIDRVRNYHLHCQATTPFTRSPCIIPITHARLWNSDGFTLSLWLQIKGSQSHKSTSQLNDDDTRSSRIEDENFKTHIVSIGSNQAMLSIYINSNMNLVFETFKPNAEIQARLPTNQNDENCDVNNTTVINDNNTQDTNHNNSHATSPFRNALKHTKLVLLNSFSNMHLFNGHSEGEPYFETSMVNLRYFRMLKNKWTQLTVAATAQSDRLDLIIYIDGLEQHTISLPFNNLRNCIKAHTFQSILLGDGAPTHKSLNNTTNFTESRSTLDGFPFRYSISNLILFNRKITQKESIVNLTAMGPDFTELTQCQVANWKPNYAYLNLTKMHNANFGNFGDAMKQLKDSRILSYTAQQPEFVMGYDASVELDGAAFVPRVCGLILYGELVQNELTSLQTAAVLCGGLSTLVYLFARVVEVSSQSATQATALDILLNAALTDSQLYAEFLRNDYISLIGYVIKSERCTKDTQLLRCIINSACSQPLITKRGGETLQVNENTITSLVYPRLLVSVLHRYADWHRSGADHSDVLDMLFASILALTREKHPHRDFNMEQLNKAGLLKELLNLCKVYVIESPNPVYISKQAAESFVNILSVFAGSPPSASLLDEIMKLLLLLHKPSECYITHDRNKFYFLLTPLPPAKSKAATNLSRVAAPFRRNFIRERPGVAVPVQPPVINELELKRLERINRLRKLHMRDSTYKRALNEFEENIENIADCSKLNKSAMRLISPVEAAKWRAKYKRQLPLSPKHGCSPNKLQKANSNVKSSNNNDNKSSPRSVLSPLQKIAHKRVRLPASAYSHSQLISTDGEKRCSRRRSVLNSDNNLRNSPGNMEHEQTMMDDVFENSSPTKRRSGNNITKTDFYNSVGIVTMQEGLFKLLKNFLCLMPDKAVEDVLKHYIKVEYLLVLANHSSCAVRAAIIQLLAPLTKRLPQIELTQCYKNFYPQHLANQLTIHPTDANMFEALVEWISGIYGDANMILNCDLLRIQNRFGLPALLANATKITATNVEFAERAFQILNKFYISNPEDQQLLLEAGLLQGCTKALYYCFSKINFSNLRIEQAILDFLTVIGEKSLKSVGQVNIIWDILNMLTFYQEEQPESIVRNFRSVQAQLQLNWLNMFFVQTNVPWSYKVSTLPDSTLTLAETKTRLDLLIDRCSQFFTVVYEANYTPSEHEIKLFELLVSYGISTNQRCNNFIAWGLQPSRPRDLRAFIVNALWILCQDDYLPTIICDGKMIKSLLWLCLLEDLDVPIPNLVELCQRLGIKENDSTWNLENELSRIELNRCTVSAKQKQMLEKTVYKMETLAVSCIESSMTTTRRVTELQNAERKLLIGHMKDYDETSTYTKWVEIIRRMTHEGAPWYCKERYETSWELDDTEGPSRVHTRLRRCHLDIDKRFIMEDYRPVAVSDADTLNSFARNDEYSRPLEYLISTYDQQLNISLNSQILYNFPAKYLPVDGEIEGEIIVTDHKLWFLATYRCKYFYVTCDISNITEIWLKRYQHQEKAFEIFLDSNQSLFFSLQNQDDWKIMQDVFCDKIVTPPDSGKVQQITQQWRDGLLTNWEYLMTLNQIAGRTYNDLMQYPVFPWILSNYTAEILDLTDSRNFRRLEKPIAVQHEENETHYKNNYAYINNTVTNMGSLVLKPYHYSSHYSNSGTVLHFMVRVPPFTSYFLRYQDNNFDLPDRTFHALSTTWKLASRDSPTDVKELIPEFFCLPEMFENFERFNFGCRQSGERVEDVLLPPWCLRDPRLFVLIHRQALESEVVRNNLHQWIDLIFGYKQTGEHAVEAINVFHPATYSVFLESEIEDPIERRAVETMVKTYGQMPRQLFKLPHISSKQFNYCIGDKKIVSTVCGLRWGVYLGSPQLPTPRLGNIHNLPLAEKLLSFANTNVVYGLPDKSCVMQGAEVDTYNVIFWGSVDRIVRIQPLNKMYGKAKNLLHNTGFDDITACGADANSNQLWFGHKSGRISVYKCFADESRNRATKSRQSYVRGLRLSYNSAFRKITAKSSTRTAESETDGETISATHSTTSVNSAELAPHDSADLIWQGPTVLVRHNDEITCISLSVEFKIAVTAGRDGIAVIWDLNNWSYVRTIEQPAEIHHSPVTLIAISPTLGDIVTVHTIPGHKTSSAGNNQSNGQSPGDPCSSANVNTSFFAAAQIADECFEVTEENLDDFVNVAINPNGKSILRLHTVNARYVQHIVHEERILDVCYSYIKEGVGVNVIATAIEGGIVRLWSSWNLSFVSEIITGMSNIRSIIYSTHQHLVVLSKESHIQVWETDGLFGNSPKFPQIQYK